MIAEAVALYNVPAVVDLQVADRRMSLETGQDMTLWREDG